MLNVSFCYCLACRQTVPPVHTVFIYNCISVPGACFGNSVTYVGQSYQIIYPAFASSGCWMKGKRKTAFLKREWFYWFVCLFLFYVLLSREC